MRFADIKDKLSDLEFEDIFPLYARTSDVRGLLKTSGIYLAVIIAAILLVFLLGWVFILGVIIKIISFVAAAYALVGLAAELLNFMKYN